MQTCPSCGQENPDGFRLCGMCGAALATVAPAAREERKVVTVLFCDLVGFTARAEKLDPEEVRAVLRPYHERVRSELERHGGTVEKFIGDAVMALFGAPTAHEDDPERAVRSALAIRDFAAEESLELRIGVTTGEALVVLGATPSEGEGMASGDVVNTAARLQSAAPVNGILVDETTYRATRAAVDYEEADAVEAKGKAEPVSVWVATAAHSRFGIDTAHEARSELVGRDRELGLVREVFERARHDRTPQLLTLVGVPGIGKSRLVYELQSIVDADPELITWRQGRCLAYGDGITLWALGEIVKAQAGVLEQDTHEEIAAKIHQTVEDVLTGTGDGAWVEAHLLALLGLAEETQLGGDRRNEAFSAWRRFLEGLADQRPLVLIVEDIHWADDSLLDFLDELVDWMTDVPLLMVCTARPELLERRGGWGGGKLNATTLALSPLSDGQTTELIAKLLQRPLLAAEQQQALLDRAGGNPLYAEQFAELYLEQGSAEELRLPETLQGIIAARLDGLLEAEKALLQDAAVVGKVFWASSIGRDPEAATASLHSLERKGFVRRQRRSSLEGESEYAFAHALVRDVSYGQIPRANRAERHRAVAEWIDGLGRPEDHAEMLAYHWQSALELVRASGGEDLELEERTRLALRAAGDRAFALNGFAVAAAQYEQALALWPADGERPDLLFRHAHALHWLHDEHQLSALEGARDALLEIGDREKAGEAEAILSRVAWFRGDVEKARRHLEEAERLVADAGPTVAKARVLGVAARWETLEGNPDAGRRIAEAALELAEELELDELRVFSLTTLGTAKAELGDPTGAADLERALELARAVDSPLASTVLNNMGALLREPDGYLARWEELVLEAIRVAERFGDAEMLRFLRASLVFLDWALGRWDDALARADVLVAEYESGSPHNQEATCRVQRAAISLARGDRERAVADLARAQTLGVDDSMVYNISAESCCELGRWEDARRWGSALVSELRAHPANAAWEIRIAPYAARLGIRDELYELVSSAPKNVWNDLTLLALEHDFVGAAEHAAAMGGVTLEAVMRSAAGAYMIETGRPAEGELELDKALAFWRAVGARFYVERDEALLARAATG